MFWKIPLFRLGVRFGSLLALSFVAMIATAPAALASCSCMCVDGGPLNVCTGFINSQEQTAECDLLSCPAVDDPATTTTTTETEDPVVTVEPPHPSLQCEHRAVFRPDLGKYKNYKVCKPSSGKHRSGKGKNTEAWAAIDERMNG
jgi:hypothetical protein